MPQPSTFRRQAVPASSTPPHGTWPLRTHLALGVLPTAVPCARLHARHLLRDWNLGGLAETVELIVSELVTNAIRISARADGAQPGYGERAPLGCVLLWLSCDRRRVLVEVGDSSPRPPVVTKADPNAESGRGLPLVEAVSLAWGYYYPAAGSADSEQRQMARKIVWALAGPG
jgi:anti-sigma regulatory factor (Ser/Thr protein kinase)